MSGHLRSCGSGRIAGAKCGRHCDPFSPPLLRLSQRNLLRLPQDFPFAMGHDLALLIRASESMSAAALTDTAPVRPHG